MSADDLQSLLGRMTALDIYDRLESLGLWRETSQDRGRNVVVALRNTTLVLSDPKSDLALTHWSLPAVQRLNPGALPALFAPGAEADEMLEIDDPNMISALEAVQHALLRRRARPGRLRALVLTGATAMTVAFGVLWLPDALVQHTARVLPAISQTEIGRMALNELTRLTGPPCDGRLGTLAASRLATRLFGAEAAVLMILGDGLEGALALPGGLIVLGRNLIETPPDAETPAGYALAAAVEAETKDPMLALLKHAGMRASFRLLTTGKLPDDALRGYAEVLLRHRPDVPAAALLARFADAGVPISPYAYSLDPTGETVRALIKADPPSNPKPKPLLADGEWVSLQAICHD